MWRGGLLLLLSSLALHAEPSRSDLQNIPLVRNYETFTAFRLDPALDAAMRNRAWMEANEKLLHETVPLKVGRREMRTIDYAGIVQLLKQAAEQGITLAAFEGYRLTSILTMKQGEHGKNDVGFFAKQMKRHGICLGYIETAYGYSRGWYGTGIDWERSYRVLQEGERSCADPALPAWQRRYFQEYRAQYAAMRERKR